MENNETWHHDWYDDRHTSSGTTQMCTYCDCVAFVDKEGNMLDIDDKYCPGDRCCWKTGPSDTRD